MEAQHGNRQIAREEDMVERGQVRAQRQIDKALDRGEASETPAGRALQKRAIAPLVEAIKGYVQKSYEGPVTQLTTAAIILKDLNPELCAYVTVRACLSAAVSGYGLKNTARTISDSIEMELLGERFEQLNPGLYAAVIKRARERALTPARQGNAIKMAAKKFELCPVHTWAQHERLKLGTTLVDLFVKTVGIVQVTTSLRGKTTSHIIEFTAEMDEWFRKYNSASTLVRPLFLPMVIPPRDWEAVDAGPYWSSKIRQASLVTKPFPGQVDVLKKADLSAVYKGLNGLQRTAWKINGRVLDVMKEAWERDAGLTCLPSREDIPVPPPPPEVEADVRGGEIRKAWRSKMREIHAKNARQRSTRFEFVRGISLAEENRHEEAIYFPHRLDFRGRAYAASTSLNPQGSDEAKALIMFAEGKPLGERGLFWLGVHGSNLFGNDKVSLEDRYEWALNSSYRTRKVAEDPLGDLWWTEADSPWGFLAWCFEWAEATQLDHPEEYVSHLPIAMDGSCNGIQHFSAMLRDPIGGAAVNLVPGEKPNDIYGRVAERAVEQLKVLAQEGEPESWMADAWVRFGINRKITKRPVMVLPYGGKFKSCLDYVRDAVKERLDAGEENPFGDDIHKATGLLAKVIWASIGDVVVAARAAMSWLQACARVCNSAGVPIRWTTPSGFVVLQDYREMTATRIKTRFNGSVIWFASTEVSSRIDASKQASAVSPNFVHSLDASALMLTVGRALDEGIHSFAMIHDSYGTHAADTDKLNRILREEFVGMYLRHDVLANFRDEISKQLPAVAAAQLPPLPPKGTLDLEAVKDSAYFFA